MAHADDFYPKLLDTLAKTQLLIIDDLYNRRSIALATQIPVSYWQERLGNLTLSDALMHRIRAQRL